MVERRRSPTLQWRELAAAFAMAAQQQTGAPDGRRLAIQHLRQFFERPAGGLRVIDGGKV